MFDDVNKNDNNNTPNSAQNQPSGAPQSPQSPAGQMPPQTAPKAGGKVEDIYAGVEKEETKPGTAPQASPAPQAPATPAQGPSMGKTTPETPPVSNLGALPRDNRKFLVIGMAVVGFLLIIGVIYLVYTKISDMTQYTPIDVENGEEVEATEEGGSEMEAEPAETAEPEEEPAQVEEDNDGDGLTNAEEREYGTNLNSVDSDEDGLFDKDEVMVYKSDPLDPDTDNDGVMDGAEVKAGTDPKGPGRLFTLPGGVEPQVPTTTPEEETEPVDSDGDGLMDDEEEELGTNPMSADSDMDDLGDYEEVYVYNTNPLDPDTDNDGYLDGAEVANGYDPNGPGKLNQ